VPVVLIEHPEAVSPATAIVAIPWSCFRPDGWDEGRGCESMDELLLGPQGGPFGLSGFWRTFFFLGDGDPSTIVPESWILAADAGKLLGDWRKAHGISEETLRHEPAPARWLFALFDLAWSDTSVFPMEAKQYPLEAIRGPSEDKKGDEKDVSNSPYGIIEDEKTAIKHLLDFLSVDDGSGFIAHLPDFNRASMHAITIFIIRMKAVKLPRWQAIANGKRAGETRRFKRGGWEETTTN